MHPLLSQIFEQMPSSSSKLAPPVLLLPPPRPSLSRTRASSTCVRPPLSLTTTAPRPRAGSYSVTPDPSDAGSSQASSCASTSASSPAHETPTLDLSLPAPRRALRDALPMFPLLVSRTVELLRALRPGAPGKHAAALFASPLSSPRSSTDTEYILPISASPLKTSFDSLDLAPPRPQSRVRVNFRLPATSVSPRLREAPFAHFAQSNLSMLCAMVGTYARATCARAFPPLHRPDPLLPLHPPHPFRLAPHPLRPRPARQRPQRVRTVRAPPNAARPRRPLRIGSLEARLVSPGQRVMGKQTRPVLLIPDN